MPKGECCTCNIILRVMTEKRLSPFANQISATTCPRGPLWHQTLANRIYLRQVGEREWWQRSAFQRYIPWGLERHISLSEQTSIRLGKGMDLPGTCQLKWPPTSMEIVISPEAGRSSCGYHLTSGNQLPEREGPSPLTVERSKWSPTSKMSRMLGLLLSMWNRPATLAGRVGCPADGTPSSSSQLLSSQENQSSRTRCPKLLISSGYSRNNLSRSGWWV